MQNLYESFLHKNFCMRSNYSNRAVIYVNHTKIFLHENFLHENKANYGTSNDAKARELNILYEQEKAHKLMPAEVCTILYSSVDGILC